MDNSFADIASRADDLGKLITEHPRTKRYAGALERMKGDSESAGSYARLVKLGQDRGNQRRYKDSSEEFIAENMTGSASSSPSPPSSRIHRVAEGLFRDDEGRAGPHPPSLVNLPRFSTFFTQTARSFVHTASLLIHVRRSIMSSYTAATVEGFVIAARLQEDEDQQIAVHLFPCDPPLQPARRGPQKYRWAVETWEKAADLCSERVEKGKRVMVIQSLRQDRWEGKDGKPQSKIKLVGNLRALPRSDEARRGQGCISRDGVNRTGRTR